MNRRNQHKEPIEGMKVWLLLGYLKLHFYDEIRTVRRFPQAPHPPPVDTFFTVRLTKNIIEHKRCRIRFYNGLYACLIFVFMNNKRAINVFLIFEFFVFLFSNIAILAYFDPNLLFLSLKFL